ncbi:P-type ATPase [Ostreococcus tauri]|uniref:P-type ATPase n=1 Tax=Ostreococcus tauri TaxID=70448 RepID=A0A1Y5I471_OSTTA|nr:P-type ATPase [Ostreococcus tauri]
MSKSKAEAKAERAAALRKDVDFVEHTWEADRLYEHFGCTLEKGLSAEQVLVNRAKYGENRLTPPELTPWYIKFLMQFANFFALLLLGGGALCFVGYGIDSEKDATNLYLGVVLFTVVIITATFSYLQEAKSEAIMEGFKSMIPKKCKVIRDGKAVVLDAWELVPGDVVELNDGDQVPADIRVMKSNELKVDNSSLTGESEPQDRSPELARTATGELVTQPLESVNLCFYTTIINSGSGRGVVIGSGDRTVMGQIAGLATETSSEDSPIAKEIKKFIQLISIVAITLGVVFFIVGLTNGTEIIQNVVFMIGIIVANVPEGLLATVTVSLALTAKRMHSKNVLVKNLEAVETLGSTTVIASDKTGTLTQNRMTVVHAWYDNEVVFCPAGKNIPDLKVISEPGMTADGEKFYDTKSEAFQRLLQVATLCNNAEYLTKNEDGSYIDLKAEMMNPTFNILKQPASGDASEQGLLKLVQPLNDALETRAAYPKLFEIKFNSTNKWQLSIHKQPGGKPPLLVLKGAPERVLAKCTSYFANGKTSSKTSDFENTYTTAYEGLGGRGERVLGFAFKELSGFKDDFKFTAKPKPNFPIDDLTFVGLLSLIDPPREGVPEAVTKCNRARIKVYMVTGDHPITAAAIAKQVNIITQENLDNGSAIVVKGDDIRAWTEIEDQVEQRKKWDWALDHKQIVWARVSPAHKLLIVENCQRRGEIVAVTGDGVNDAPALKKGDIGVAMGIAGKDVSKEAADMILMDDNFASIVNGVEEGRLIFDNLKKSIAYTLSSNIPEIAPFLIYITMKIPLPLSTVLILCVDLGTDMVPAISMAYEEKEADIMDRPPRDSKKDRLVNFRLISFAYFQIGIIQALAGFFTYMLVLNDYGYTPSILVGNGLEFLDSQLLCTLTSETAVDSSTGNQYFRPKKCGFGCADSKEGPMKDVCVGGCAIPRAYVPGNPLTSAHGTASAFLASDSNFAVDPFIEFDENGFRGEGYTCSRGCSSRADNSASISTVESTAFAYMCDAGGHANANSTWGFSRGYVDGRSIAPKGAYYWWNGAPQSLPNMDYQKAALEYAQTAYFITIIIVQWADLLIAKTRKLSIFEQDRSRRDAVLHSICQQGVRHASVAHSALVCRRPVVHSHLRLRRASQGVHSSQPEGLARPLDVLVTSFPQSSVLEFSFTRCRA